MGLDTASVQFLCAAKSLGVNFTTTAMIGRQAFWPGEDALKRVFATLGLDLDVEAFLRENEFGERFFAALGAKEIVSVDYSSYEAASVLHDMNVAIPDELKERFSAVHDGGTIEHVFNVYQALKNCMEMVSVGGHFTQVNAANNYMGHGFWQFSPETIFRAFSPANGYKIEAVFLHENVPGGAWYLVRDPDEVQSRVELCNSSPTYILTVAKRVAMAEIFAHSPQQSDYVIEWQRRAGPRQQPETHSGEPPANSRLFKAGPKWWRHVPPGIKSSKYFVQRLLGFDGTERGFNPSFFRQISEEALLHGRL
jgi:hypothetical protein